MWAPDVRRRGVLWVVLWGVALRCSGVRESRTLSVCSGENATWEGFELSLVCRIGALARYVWWARKLNHPIRRGNKPMAGERPQVSLLGRKVGAAHAPARTHSRRPMLATPSIAP